MKKSIKLCLLLTITAVAVFTSPLQAQDATKDMLGFTKKFQDTYNKKDSKGLKTMYADNAVRVNIDGTSVTGNGAIADEFAKAFTDNTSIAIEIKQNNVVSNADGSLTATGTYHVTGTNKAGEKIDRVGHYNNSVVKVGSLWKISKSVLTDN